MVKIESFSQYIFLKNVHLVYNFFRTSQVSISYFYTIIRVTR